jgi:regulator of nucleoside diphosphate kinase
MEQIAARRDPPLLIGDQSEALLRGIARAAMTRAPEVAERLLGEVERADVVAESAVPNDVVRIGSFVTYQVRLTGSINTIRLVPPREADLHKSRVSVVSEVGAALIGLKRGQQIEWEFGGHRHVLEVLRVAREL